MSSKNINIQCVLQSCNFGEMNLLHLLQYFRNFAGNQTLNSVLKFILIEPRLEQISHILVASQNRTLNAVLITAISNLSVAVGILQILQFRTEVSGFVARISKHADTIFNIVGSALNFSRNRAAEVATTRTGLANRAKSAESYAIQCMRHLSQKIKRVPSKRWKLVNRARNVC